MIRSTLRAKLVRTMVATLALVATATLLVVAGMNVASSQRTLQNIQNHIRAGIESKGRSLVENQALALRDLASDNAFSDVERLIQRTVELDSELVFGLFLDSEENPWGFEVNNTAPNFPKSWKTLGIQPGALLKPGVAVDHRKLAERSFFQFAMPVLDDRSQRLGTLIYGVSDASLIDALAEARSESQQNLILTVAFLGLLGASALIIGLALSRRAAAQITRPVSELTSAVNTLASGQREISVSITSGDELQVLGDAFNQLVADLKESYQRLETMNRTLEHKVDERTRALSEKNRDLRLVMDNVHQGFLTISAAGVLAVERSSMVDEWFGSFGPGTRYADYFQRIDPTYAASFELGLEAIAEDILPLDLNVEQLPSRIRRDEREYHFRYRPIMKAGMFDGLLVVINDATTELAHARQESERKETLALFDFLIQDRNGLASFVQEADSLVSQLPDAHFEKQCRLLHTLKGNAGMLGLSVMIGICHELEDQLLERGQPHKPADLLPLIRRWEDLKASSIRFLGDKDHESIELDLGEAQRLADMIRTGAPTEAVLTRIAEWSLEPTELPLRRLGRYAQALCKRLGRGPLDLVVQSSGVRLAPMRWSELWSHLIHVVRNAVDHGLEPPDERKATGKTEPARLRLSTSIQGGSRLLLEIEDNGRGIDWTLVRKAAIGKGLPGATQDDLIRAIFAAGVTTRSEVTESSGRGVGLSAVEQEVQRLGGTISVETHPGRGTCFQFLFDLTQGGEAQTPRSAFESDLPPPIAPS